MSLVGKSNTIPFYGPVTWLNLIDWLVTLCLGAILLLTTLRLGGVRPDTQADLLPLFASALALHGLWMAVHGKDERRLSPVPFIFVPFAAWACLSVILLSPVAWRGGQQLVLIASAFIFFWIALNNLRTRAHLWTLIVCGLAPATQAVFMSFYQFFQSKSSLASAGVDYALELHPQYVGRSTGLFADPDSFAAYTLILLPCFLIAAVVPRLPIVLRVLCFYLSAIIVVSITFAQSYWAVVMVAVLMVVIPLFCFEKFSRRLYGAGGGLLAALAVFLVMYFANPRFQGGFTKALTPDGEGIRLTLWKDALSVWWSSPILGQGAGAYTYAVEQSNPSMLPFVPVTPHNDFLMVLAEYGLIGAFLLWLPLGFLFFRSYRTYTEQPFSRRISGPRTRRKMPAQKFFLSIGLCGGLAYGLAAFFGFPSSIPALLLLGIMLLVICSKYSFNLSLPLPSSSILGPVYCFGAVVAGILFSMMGAMRLDSQALELRASEELESIVAQQIPIAGDPAILDGLIHLYEDAILYDPENADAWLGLSAAICQTHYRHPGNFKATSARALEAAERAYRESPNYWRVHAQMGIAHALGGDLEAADSAFARAVELAPHSSNANYYYAAFLSEVEPSSERAVHFVQRALEIDPEHGAARQLQSRLFVL